MMRWLHLAPLLSLLVPARSDDFTFVNPLPYGPNSDYSQDVAYVVGSEINIQWTWKPESNNSTSISLLMFQQIPNAPFDYVFQNQDLANSTSFPWTVTTQRNLSLSNVFFFEIFYTGATGVSGISHYFNLTDGSSTGGAQSTSSVASTSSASSTASSATHTPTAASSSASPEQSSATANPSSGGLSTGAKIGLGVGIPLAVIAGVLVGWAFFVFRKRRSERRDADARTRGVAELKDSEAAQNVYRQPSITGRGELYTVPVEMPNYGNRG